MKRILARFRYFLPGYFRDRKFGIGRATAMWRGLRFVLTGSTGWHYTSFGQQTCRAEQTPDG